MLSSNFFAVARRQGRINLQFSGFHILSTVVPEFRKDLSPFFTTKGTEKGTGLGLWVSYNIIEKMGGTITLKSEGGKGATFTVQIPIVFPEKE